MGFAILQFRHGVNYFTAEGVLTAGASHRWWDLYSVWGPFATTGKNDLGGAVSYVAAVLGPWAIFRQRKRALRLLAVLLVAASFWTSYEAGSRQALVAIGVTIIVTMLLSRKWRPRLLPILAIPTLIIAMGFVSLLRLGNPSGLPHPPNTTRFATTRALLDHVSPMWIVGTGFNTITGISAQAGIQPSSLALTQTPEASAAVGGNTDDLYLRRLIESGILGEASFLWLVYALLKEGWRHRRSLTSEGRAWAAALVGLGTALALESAVSDTLDFAQLSAVFFLLVGVAGRGLFMTQHWKGAECYPLGHDIGQGSVPPLPAQAARHPLGLSS